MISRPMHGGLPVVAPSTSTPGATLHQLSYLQTHGKHTLTPVRRTKSFGFRPRLMPPVNKVVGPPRMYG